MPYEFPGKDAAWVRKRRTSQLEIIKVLRQEHLICRIIKSRDEDQLIVLIRAPTYEQFSLVQVLLQLPASTPCLNCCCLNCYNCSWRLQASGFEASAFEAKPSQQP